eukprot:IDg4950t1
MAVVRAYRLRQALISYTPSSRKHNELCGREKGKMASFKMPIINDNPDGWGPPMDLVPQRFQDMPYAPFSKSDRLGRAADWSAYGNRYGREGAPEEGGSEFTMVDNKVVPKTNNYGRGRGGFRGGFRGSGRGRYGDRFGDRRDGRDGRGRHGRGGASRGGRGGYRRWDDRRNMQREASVEVGADWAQMEEITSSALTKLSYTGVGAPEDLAKCGTLPYFDRGIDRVTAKASRPLVVDADAEFPRVTTTDDPVIRRIAGSGEGTVFATASILSTIMVAPRAVQSWDIVVQRIGGKLFFDKRDGSSADLITVNETSHDAPKDEKNMAAEDAINSFQQLAIEATAINSNFAKMAVNSAKSYKFPETNPFEEDAEGPIPAAGYRYRKWELTEDITVVARCDIEACMVPRLGAEPLPISLKALNEYFDPNSRQSTDWRGKLDTQRGAVLATEVYNNASKLARWTVEALLADADQLKFGFVSRVKANDNQRHVLLGTQMYRPKEFASQIALKSTNMWGILKHIIELCYKHLQDGEKGVILKDPNKPIIRIFKVPDDAFESDEDEDLADEDDMDGASFVPVA